MELVPSPYVQPMAAGSKARASPRCAFPSLPSVTVGVQDNVVKDVEVPGVTTPARERGQ